MQAREFLCSPFPLFLRGRACVDTSEAAALPDEIQKSVDRLDRLDVAVVGQGTVPAAFARL